MTEPHDEASYEEVGDFYKDKMYIEVDTVVRSSIFTDKLGLRTARNRCTSGKLFSVEYKNTLGGALLYMVTFGGKRKVKMTYVCMKVEN